MNYYNICIINSPLSPLTYKSHKELQKGCVVKVHLRGKEQNAVVQETVKKPDFECLEIIEPTSYMYKKEQIKSAEFISSYYFCSFGEAVGIMIPYYLENIEAFAKPTCSNSVKLSTKQQDALSFLTKHKVSLLFGDTGSGKTEIYMSYFEQIIAAGKRAIFLMPEISLTPQMSKRLREHFCGHVVMWHSKLTPKQKKEALQKIYDGSAYIVAGPRSALFLPIEKLGLIVVDEEHDESYKSSSRPRYNARDMAIYIGALYGANVVLGSATPALSSYVKFPHVRLKGGHFDSSKEFVYEKSKESISPLMLSKIGESLKSKKQSIVFLPTRANFKYLVCGGCGYTYKCAFCSVGMSVHQKSRALKCHYCNFTQAIPKECPECGCDELSSSRLGTAEAVKELQERFQGINVEQFDRDAITTASKLKSVLSKFNAKEIDVLVGTQMISKGHDYHDVSLVAVLGLDNILGMSDYRAREKALSMLVQVAGRGGRKESATILVQSFNEEFFKAYIDRYEEFLEDEKYFRDGLYPPFKKLCRVLFSHKNDKRAFEATEEMLLCLRKCSDIEIVGFGRCATERVADKYRYEILIRSDKSTHIIKAVSTCRVSLAEIDMDPTDFS